MLIVILILQLLMVGLIFYYRKQKVEVTIEEEYLEEDKASSFPFINQDIPHSIYVETNGDTNVIYVHHHGDLDKIVIATDELRDEFVSKSFEYSNYNLYLVNIN